MHTLNDKPASFEGDLICYTSFYGKPNKLCPSLKQIRQEQKASREWRKSQGLGDDDVKHGYLRFSG
jgi:hypothetical protein